MAKKMRTPLCHAGLVSPSHARLFYVIVLVAILAGSAAGCGQPAAPPAATSVPSTPSSTAGTTARAGAWDKLVAAARKEGTVMVYGELVSSGRASVIAAFAKTYGINIEWTVGRSAELATKLRSEHGAGLQLADVGFNGATTFINDIVPMGISETLEPMLVLPEVKDASKWREGKLPYLNDGKSAILIGMLANSFYQRNVDLVKEQDITSSYDLLNPKWKEKIVLADPSVAGASNSWFTWMLTGVLGKENGIQFMKDLVNQKPVLTRDERQLVEWVAKGKFPIGIGPNMSVPAEFINMGAPIAFVDLDEPRSLSPSSGMINVFKRAPHPNAAKVFLNWILSKEGSTVFAQAIQFASLRVDVPPQGILPIMAPRPKDVYPLWKYPDYSAIQGELRKVAAEIVSAAK